MILALSLSEGDSDYDGEKIESTPRQTYLLVQLMTGHEFDKTIHACSNFRNTKYIMNWLHLACRRLGLVSQL